MQQPWGVWSAFPDSLEAQWGWRGETWLPSRDGFVVCSRSSTSFDICRGALVLHSQALPNTADSLAKHSELPSLRVGFSLYLGNCAAPRFPGSPHPMCCPSGPTRSADLPPFQHEPVVVTVRFPWFSQAGLEDLLHRGSSVWTMSGSNSKEALRHQNHHRHEDRALHLVRNCPEKKIWRPWHAQREPSGLHFLCCIQAGLTHTHTAGVTLLDRSFWEHINVASASVLVCVTHYKSSQKHSNCSRTVMDRFQVFIFNELLFHFY